MTIDADRVRELLEYVPETGQFYWRVHRSRLARVGSIAGGKHHTGYLLISIGGRKYSAHRLAWLYTHGEFPPDQLDHINGVRDDNRLDNLRPATRSQNQQNRKVNVDNRTGVMGVCALRNGKYQANINVNCSRIYAGTYDTVEEAHRAYLEAKQQHHAYNPTPRHLLK